MNNKNGIDDFIERFAKVEKFCDNFVARFYTPNVGLNNNDIVTRIEKNSLMQKLINSTLVNTIQVQGVDNLRAILMMVGLLAAFFAAFSMFASFIGLFSMIDAHWYSWLVYITQFMVNFITFVAGVGLLRLKKRFPFSIIMMLFIYVTFFLIDVYRLQIITFFTKDKGSVYIYSSNDTIGIIISICFFVFAAALVFAVVMRNKQVFVN